ncbi:MAG: mannose-1-phosphate guanylyltransferase [Aeromicrobium sp.]|uniref:mannose-1-phosphate guanylyltransferase n=1 Tax=Aeromicrobium sp. TaxID=1871063 RepID=UPI0039E3E4F7
MSSLLPPDVHAIVPAGGSGTRLWPLSRAARPKFLLDLRGDGRSLLQQTWDRLTPLVGPDRIHVVTGAAHADAVRAQLPALAHLIAEPSPRDSMPAIGLAAAIIARRDAGAVVASFAADHVIADEEAFADTVAQAVAAARAGLVATIGVTPTEPSTAFGYIERGARLDLPGAPRARTVRRFVEKPDTATAADYLATGDFSWNAGMFVVRADVLLDHLARLQPTLHAGVQAIADTWDGPDADAVLAEVWPTLTKIAVDHAVAEPVSLTGAMAVVPGDFGWSDVGDAAALPVRHDDSAVLVDADGLVHSTEGLPIAVVGLRDVVVLHTGDALLVADRAQSQRVREVVAELRERGRDDLL